ncbi:hypothetical protein EUA06_21395 [Nocardioides glacieisoli]|uniref:Uncharacterized protein n=1 Tax=Nocardioides glacieisoli TaxID=1168730 RepID=A0A4Q2RI73_9ACTN|nr:hypothetical protein [Nocardioides glacieisoli]RYB88421.1 hypothetical protein EUA06_21395 [Nocardioides glacieisoli]
MSVRGAPAEPYAVPVDVLQGRAPGSQGARVLLAVGRTPLSRESRAAQAGRRTGEEVGQMHTSSETDEHTPAEEEQAAPRLRVAPSASDGEPLPIARSEVSAMGEE